MYWKDLQPAIEVLETRGSLDPSLNITNIIHHSNRVREDGVFVAIPGAVVDGHDYIQKAADNGAAIAVVERFVDIELPQVRVRNARIALAQLANCFYDYPSRKMKLIGITATNGKTTTSFMLEEVLRRSGYKVGIIGTVEIKYGETVIPSDLTTPESIDLQKYLYDMQKAGVEIVIMEVSSSAQELYRNYGIDFDIVSFHNISAEHIEQHGSFEKYLDSKSRLVREASRDTAVIINRDFPELESLLPLIPGEIFVLSSKLEKDPDVFIEDLDLKTGKGQFTCLIRQKYHKRWGLDEGKLKIQLGIAGYSSVLNSLVAITAAKLLGVSDQIITEALRLFSGVERRFELIYDGDYKILDDHFANLKNIETTMQTLEKMDHKNLHIVYAIRGNRGVNLNKENAQELSSWVKKLAPKSLVVTASRDVTGPKDQVSREEEEACRSVLDVNSLSYSSKEDLQESINEIMPKLEKGDILLLAGCQGMDKGARYVWKYLLDKEPTINRSEIEEKIANRIC